MESTMTYQEAFFAERRFRCDKWEHYFEIYDELLGNFYGKDVNYLEIGVQHGGSLEIANLLFGKSSKFFGVDIDPKCKLLEQSGVASRIFIGSQVDPKIIDEAASLVDSFDVVVDDGSHIQAHMVGSFIRLFPHVKEGGIYIIEDTHTNFSPEHQSSFFGIGLYDYFKGLSERLNLDFIDPNGRKSRFKLPRERREPIAQLDGHFFPIRSIQFFNSLIAIRKGGSLEPLRIAR
jgi:hypothetical protein